MKKYKEESVKMDHITIKDLAMYSVMLILLAGIIYMGCH